MVRVYFRKSRLMAEALAGVIFGLLLVGAGVLFFTELKTADASISFGSFFSIFGALMLFGAASPVITLYKKAPALILSEDGLRVGLYWGRFLKFNWSDVDRISVLRRLEAGRRYREDPYAHVQYLEIHLRNQTKALKLSEARLETNLEVIVSRLKEVPAAAQILDPSALTYRYQTDFQRMNTRQRVYLFLVIGFVLVYLTWTSFSRM